MIITPEGSRSICWHVIALKFSSDAARAIQEWVLLKCSLMVTFGHEFHHNIKKMHLLQLTSLLLIVQAIWDSPQKTS